MDTSIRVCNPTGDLLQNRAAAAVREENRFLVSMLGRKPAEINAFSIESGRRSSFKPTHLEPNLPYRGRKFGGSLFSRPTRSKLLLSNMTQPVQGCSGCENHDLAVQL